VLSTALALQAAGYSIIPLWDKEPYDPLKAPYLDQQTGKQVERPRLSWNPYKQRRATAAQLLRWFAPTLPHERQPNGIGIFSGAVSGGIQVLDFETSESFQAWVKLVGRERVERLCVVKTGRGYHVLFTCPTPHTEKHATVEARGDDLYFVAVGSWHPTAQRPYQLITGDICKLPRLSQAEADYLVQAALPPAPLVTPKRTTESTPKQVTPGNLTPADVRAAFNQRTAMRDLILDYGGRLAHRGLYHCPAAHDHRHGDAHGSFLIRESTKPDKYGQWIGGCYSASCRLHTGPGRVLSSFDLLQIMDGLTPGQAVKAAADKLGYQPLHAAPPPTLAAPKPIGRPRKLTDNEYRTQAALLAEGRDERKNPRLLMTRAELAQRLGIKPATAAAIERRLTRIGLWQRQQVGQYGSVVTILPGKTCRKQGVNNAFAEVVEGVNNYQYEQHDESDVCSIPTPQNANFEADAIKACDFVAAPVVAPAAVPVAAPLPPPPAPPVLDLATLQRNIGPLYGKRAKLERLGEHVPRWLRDTISDLERKLADAQAKEQEGQQTKSHAQPPATVPATMPLPESVSPPDGIREPIPIPSSSPLQRSGPVDARPPALQQRPIFNRYTWQQQQERQRTAPQATP
jgi:hypothetical protein